MTEFSPLHGRLDEVSLPRVLHHMSRESIDGALRVDADDGGVTIHVLDKHIRCVSVHPEVASIDEWLEEKGVLGGEELDRARGLMSTESIPFGRAMMNLDFWDPEVFWEWETSYQLDHLYRCFDCEKGTYGVTTGTDTAPAWVSLDISLHTAIAEGIRRMRNAAVIQRELAGVRSLFVYKKRPQTELGLKPHERHILDLLIRESNVEKVIKSSFLPAAHIRRVLFMLLAAERVSTRPPDEKPSHQRPEIPANQGSFNSFEDALKYYNLKYEMVFRVLSKEIGPIALSILQKAITGIGDNLPACLRRARLRAGGGLEEEPVLKSLWYQDFERMIGEFLRGLEEILYAQIYAVKRHLGVEVEQQILKWLNRNGK